MLELEQALARRCAADEQYSTLFAQWTFDKQLVGRALNAVPQLFPHYSLHESSHSNTILRQIARMLGASRIAKLEPTDLWLILEAAYHHDLGMVVPDDQMREWWATAAFESHLDELKLSSDEDLRVAAELLDKNRRYTSGDGAWPFDVRRALVLVMADFARPRHAERSRAYVAAPSLIHLDSPRTPLVPARFWGLLGRICEAHGQSFERTMSLPRRESGFASDEAHPRFVACMLRLGDLLDLDDGRFCPVLARSFGRLPASSLSHREKHHSIVHFLVDPAEVRVVAECATPASFDATEQWFSWLRSELIQQGVHWARITPERDFGAMPSPSHIEARLNGYHTSPDGRRPRFEVDKEAMLDFVRGAGLYSDETACISELLQNAVDATLVHVWSKQKQRWLNLESTRSPNCIVELRDALAQLPIEVAVERIAEASESGASNFWRVRISDRGVGISTSDVQYLQSVGSSHKNPRRRALTRGMPEWMRPSGYFGIGLQSVFLFADKVLIRSRASEAIETIEIELSQSGRRSEPQILVRTVAGNDGRTDPGTDVTFMLQEAKVPASYRYSSEDSETHSVVSDYDALLDREMPVLPSRMRDAARRFARESFATIRLMNEEGSPRSTRRDLGPRPRSGPVFFDYETGAELDIVASLSGRIDFSYRGRTTSEYVSAGLFAGAVDWHAGTAGEVLTINREKFRAGARTTIEDGVWRAILNSVSRYYDIVVHEPARVEERRHLALAARVYPEIAARLNADDATWRQLKYPGTDWELGSIVDAPSLEIVEDPTWSAKSNGLRKPAIEPTSGGVRISAGRTETWLWDLLRTREVVLSAVEEIKPEHERASWSHWRETWIATASPATDALADVSVFRYVMLSASKTFLRSARRTIPCPHEFRPMSLKEGADSALSYSSWLFHRMKPRCVFPFRVSSGGRISLDGLPELIRWTFQHRAMEATTEIEVARAVLGLVSRIDELMRDEWGERVDYSASDSARQLRKLYGDDIGVAIHSAPG